MEEKKTVVYLAGKITGDDNYKEKFNKYAEKLERFGLQVINPAHNPQGLRPDQYMRICFQMLDCADYVIFLPDYQDSPGAKLEEAYAKYIGKPSIPVTSLIAAIDSIKEAFTE